MGLNGLRVWVWDGLFALAVLLGAGVCAQRYGAWMDGYEVSLLWLGALLLSYMASRWGSLKGFMLAVAMGSGAGLWLYGGDLALAQSSFWLRYLLASQSALLWMAVMFGLALVAYWVGLLGRFPTALFVGSSCTWFAAVMGAVGLLVRWYEGYLIGPDVGHVPVSNLYEVFVLFVLLTALFYLFYEQVYKTRQLGAFVLLVVVAAVCFLLWYGVGRQAYAIQPLVPALQSWWMKIHVPANFIGYGTFSLAAMVAVAYLLKVHVQSGFWGRVFQALPSLAVLDDWMYKSISVGFAFFTLATILGALWAADAWGAYWQWDPKETWALVVWLNYAAWLHMRLIKGWRGVGVAYWALGGLLVTSFAFLGVNLWLSGLHSYGQL